jgi:hypothetical protein
MSLDDLYTNYPKEGIRVRTGLFNKTKAGIEAVFTWGIIGVIVFIGWQVLMSASPEARNIASGIGLYSEPSKISIDKGRAIGGLNEYKKADELIASLNPGDALTDTLKHQMEYCSKPAWWQWGRKFDRRTCLIYTYSMAAEVAEAHPDKVERYKTKPNPAPMITMSPAMSGQPMPAPSQFYNIRQLQNQ